MSDETTADVGTTTAEPDHHGVAGELERLEERLPVGTRTPAPGLLPGELTPHPAPVQYVVIAVILVVVTAAEVSLYYLEGEISNALIVAALLVLATIKFSMVASWYMHLKTDQPIFRRFFVVGVVAAIVLYLVVLLTLHVFE